jgi:hypothetical protein
MMIQDLPTVPESRSGRRARLDKLRETILHRKVLARHLPGLVGPEFQGRWTRRQWAHASLFATLGALVAALVPGFSAPQAGTAEASLAAPRTTLALALPALPLHRRPPRRPWSSTPTPWAIGSRASRSSRAAASAASTPGWTCRWP